MFQLYSNGYTVTVEVVLSAKLRLANQNGLLKFSTSLSLSRFMRQWSCLMTGLMCSHSPVSITRRALASRTVYIVSRTVSQLLWSIGQIIASDRGGLHFILTRSVWSSEPLNSRRRSLASRS